MKSNTKNEPVDQNSSDFKNMVDLLAVFSEASNRLAEIEATGNKELLELLDSHRADYAEAQEAATKAEAALEVIARRNPGWFQNARSVKTPYGVLKFHEGTSLKIDNEEATLAKLELHAERNKGFKLDDYIHTHKKPNKEALEKLDDATLRMLGVVRVPDDNFSAKPAKVDMGKALKQSTPIQSQSQTQSFPA